MAAPRRSTERTARTPKNARAPRRPTAAEKRKAAAAARKAAALLETQKAAFLTGLSETHIISEAAKRAGVHRQRLYEWRGVDEDFAAAWAEIEERSTELLEREAYRRAAVGTEKPVYQGGQLVGTVKEFSDVLLIFLLKARRPDTYREQHRVELAGSETPIRAEIVAVDARKRSDAAREYLARIAGDG